MLHSLIAGFAFLSFAAATEQKTQVDQAAEGAPEVKAIDPRSMVPPPSRRTGTGNFIRDRSGSSVSRPGTWRPLHQTC